MDYQKRLDCYLKAEQEMLESGAVVTVEGTNVTFADLDSLRSEIKDLRLKVEAQRVSRVGPRTMSAVF